MENNGSDLIREAYVDVSETYDGGDMDDELDVVELDGDETLVFVFACKVIELTLFSELVTFEILAHITSSKLCEKSKLDEVDDADGEEVCCCETTLCGTGCTTDATW